MEKNELRKKLLLSRDSLTEQEVKNHSDLICNKLKELTDFDHVMLYMATGNECCLDNYIQYLLEEQKSIYLPVCVDKGIMKASLVKDLENDLEIGKFDIRAPKKECYRFVEPDILDAVIVPGVGFDRNGARMGFGGGFYDRYLPKTRRECKKIAVCYESQLINNIYPEDHDYPMDIIVTEKAVYRFDR